MDILRFTSENVSINQPDNLSNQIANCILDAILEQDPYSHVVCDVTAQQDQVHIMGEVSGNANVNYERVIRDAIRRYDGMVSDHLYDADCCKVTVDFQKGESGEDSKETEASLQNEKAITGFASNETKSLMPLASELAHNLTMRLIYVYENRMMYDLLPEGNAQITLEYHDRIPVRIHSVSISGRPSKGDCMELFRNDIMKYIVAPTLPEDLLDTQTLYCINSSKEMTEEDWNERSGLLKPVERDRRIEGRNDSGSHCLRKPDQYVSYMARYLAKNIVAAGLAERCRIEIENPAKEEETTLQVNTFGTGKLYDVQMADFLRRYVDLTPAGIIKRMVQREPFFGNTSYEDSCCSVNPVNPWEKTELSYFLKSEYEKVRNYIRI